MSQDNNDQSMDSSSNEFETGAESITTMPAVTVVETSSGEEVQITIEDEQVVAKGGWSTVSKARIIPTGQVVALKRIRETSQYKVIFPYFRDLL